MNKILTVVFAVMVFALMTTLWCFAAIVVPAWVLVLSALDITAGMVIIVVDTFTGFCTETITKIVHNKKEVK